MKRLTKDAGICSLLLNLMPFIIYASLIKPQGELLTAALPFAIYYAFRRAGLLLFRDLEYNTCILGWIGISGGIIGYALGIFGNINPLFWDLSGVGAGLASTLFPTALSQRKRMIKRGLLPTDDHVNPLIQLAVLLIFLGLIAWVKQPLISFAVMTVVAILAAGTYWGMPKPVEQPLPVHWYWLNYVLVIILLGSMLMIRLGRSMGIGQPVGWGLLFLIVFFATMITGLATNRQQTLNYGSNLRLRLMLYGICGQYWSLYSTIFIGVVYGIKLYYWTIVAYLLAFMFGGLVTKKVMQLLPAGPHRVNAAMITIGILLTFWLPTYFIGIFLIRSFAGAEQKMATADYERVTHNYSISYIVNYYYSSIAGLLSQLVMWGTLFLTAGTQGMNTILGAFSLGNVSHQNGSAIMITHLVLAIYMVAFLLWVVSKVTKNPQHNDEKSE